MVYNNDFCLNVVDIFKLILKQWMKIDHIKLINEIFFNREINKDKNWLS